jgi:hypothetical protein
VEPEIPDFYGDWDGAWEKTSCVDSGRVTWCDRIQSGPFRALLSYQSGREVRGDIQWSVVSNGVHVGLASGTIALDGTLMLSGTGVILATGVPVSIAAWQSRVDGNTMSGSFQLSVDDQAASGISLKLNGRLVNVVRTRGRAPFARIVSATLPEGSIVKVAGMFQNGQQAPSLWFTVGVTLDRDVSGATVQAWVRTPQMRCMGGGAAGLELQQGVERVVTTGSMSNPGGDQPVCALPYDTTHVEIIVLERGTAVLQYEVPRGYRFIPE